MAVLSVTSFTICKNPLHSNVTFGSEVGDKQPATMADYVPVMQGRPSSCDGPAEGSQTGSKLALSLAPILAWPSGYEY